MTANERDVLAGNIEGLAQVVLYLVAQLEEQGVLDGPAFTQGVRCSIVPPTDDDALMVSAIDTLDSLADAIDQSRMWRRFRKQISPKA